MRLLLPLLLFISLSLYGQKEFTIEIDQNTGVHTKIDSVPGVFSIRLNNTTINTDSGYFIFQGADLLF